MLNESHLVPTDWVQLTAFGCWGTLKSGIDLDVLWISECLCMYIALGQVGWCVCVCVCECCLFVFAFACLFFVLFLIRIWFVRKLHAIPWESQWSQCDTTLPTSNKINFSLRLFPYKALCSLASRLSPLSPSRKMTRSLIEIQCCFTSTETIRLLRNGEPGTATLTFTQLLNSEGVWTTCTCIVQMSTGRSSLRACPQVGWKPVLGLGVYLNWM